MIIANGTIEFKVKEVGGGIDPETGYPIPTSLKWGKPIECQFIVNHQNLQHQVNGEHYRNATYIILIEANVSEKTEVLRLKDNKGQTVGEYPVISIEPLDAVCEVKILV